MLYRVLALVPPALMVFVIEVLARPTAADP
jgi:hypothetical protein